MWAFKHLEVLFSVKILHVDFVVHIQELEKKCLLNTWTSPSFIVFHFHFQNDEYSSLLKLLYIWDKRGIYGLFSFYLFAFSLSLLTRPTVMDIDMLSNYFLLSISHLLLFCHCQSIKWWRREGGVEEESSAICRHLRLSQSTRSSLCAIKSKINHRNSLLIITLIYHIYQLMTKLHGKIKCAAAAPPHCSQ